MVHQISDDARLKVVDILDHPIEAVLGGDAVCNLFDSKIFKFAEMIARQDRTTRDANEIFFAHHGHFQILA